MRYYTFKKNVFRRAGQTLGFLRGKGYFAKGKPARSQSFTMYDDINTSLIPKGAAAVAGYVGGHWPTFPLLRKLFPKALRLSIAVTASEDADCLDIESGDATIGQAPAWFLRQVARGVKRPVLYTSAANAGTLMDTMRNAGYLRGSYRLWTAHYTERPHRCSKVACGYDGGPEADATQYTSKALGRSLDASLCSATFFNTAV